MKSAILALLVALVVSQSEALRCYCGGLRHCADPVQTCNVTEDVCAKGSFLSGDDPVFFKGCMTAADCEIYNYPGISSAICCRSDLCNM